MTNTTAPRFRRVATAFLWIFAVVYAAVFIQIFLFNGSYSYSPWLQLVLLLGWVAGLCVCFAAGLRFRQLLTRYRYAVLAACLLFVFMVQLWVGVQTKQVALYDYGQVLNGAMVFATEGDGAAFAPYSSYFHYFTNNVWAFMLWQALFGALRAMGLACFYEAAIVVCHLLFTVTILFTFLYLERSFGKTAAFFSLLFFLAYLPVYLQSSVAYTDTMSIWAAPVALYLNQRAKTAGQLWRRLALWGGMGFLLGLAFQIKATAAIVGVALVLEMALLGRGRLLLQQLLAGGAFFASAVMLFNLWAYATMLDPQRLEKESAPLTFWLMMGLQGDGSFNADDEWVVTDRSGGRETMLESQSAEILRRLEEMGPVGYLQLLHRKTVRTFGSGNAEIYYSLNMQPEDTGRFIYRFIIPGGRLFAVYNNLAQAVYLSFYVFALAGAAWALRRKQAPWLANIAPFLALVGFFAFMMLWESNHRQLINQWPLFVMVAAAGAPPLARALQALPGRVRKFIEK